MTSKVIFTYLLKQDVDSPVGLIPKGTLLLDCYRHGVDDMFTRVRCMVNGKELVLSGLSLAAPWGEMPNPDWWYFPPEAFENEDWSIETCGTRPECIEHYEMLRALPADW